ncbi:MAG TPA: O-acetylhomoserine aminocarboxypropyltransferase, partial [Clostridiales bacterium]|nr:O-acetylhomoserine aminocarboxypropyltransferase [Clostridiales bacterium]
NVVIHSTSKYMDGHACAIGGVIVDGGNFDWSVFPEFSQPNASYHGVVYSEQFGNAAYIAKARTMLLRDFGAVPGPYNAFFLNLGLETLHLRMERHCQNAMEVSRYLQSKLGGDVCFVHYPGLSSDPDYPLAKKYLKNEQGVFIGASGVVSFGVAGGRERAAQWMDALKLAAIVVHVADARISVLHPASTTHRQLTDEQLSDCGITPELIRLSVGIESASDIIEDLEQALNASR